MHEEEDEKKEVADGKRHKIGRIAWTSGGCEDPLQRKPIQAKDGPGKMVIYEQTNLNIPSNLP